MLNDFRISNQYINRLLSVKKDSNVGDIITLLKQFRSQLSIRWLDQYSDERYDKEGFFRTIFSVLFAFTRYDDQNVKTAACSALGAFIYTQRSLYPTKLAGAFINIVNELEIDEDVSIPVISTFLYISQIVLPLEMSLFFERVRIIPFIGSGISRITESIPHLVPLMEALPIELHNHLLRSLMSFFGRNPDRAFAKTVTDLVSFNPSKLYPDMMDFIKTNNLKWCLVTVYSSLILNKSIHSFITIEDITLSIDTATECLKGELSFNQFESCILLLVNILFFLRKSNIENDFVYQKISEIDWDKFPQHFQKCIYYITTDIDVLMIKDSDNNTTKISKLKGLSNLLFLSKSDEQINKIFDIFMNLDKLPQECEISVIKHVIENIDTIIRCEKFGILLKKIIELESENWVLNEVICNLLYTIGIDRGCMLIYNYDEIALGVIMRCCFSSQNSLADFALNVIEDIFLIKHFKILDKFIMKLNLFSERTCLNLVRMLNKIMDRLNHPHLKVYCPLVSEFPSFTSNKRLVQYSYEFLQKNGYYNCYVSICYYWICVFYKYITQKDLPDSEAKSEHYLPYLIDQMDTNIISGNLLNDEMESVTSIYVYYINMLKQKEIKHKKELVSIELLLISPETILNNFNLIFSDRQSDNMPAFLERLVEVFYTSSDYNVISLCCKFLVMNGSDYVDVIVSSCVHILSDKSILSADTIYSLYLVIKNDTGSDAYNTLEAVKARIKDPIELLLLKIKLGQLSVESFIEEFKDINYFEWPLNDNDFVTFFQLTQFKPRVDLLEISDFNNVCYVLRNRSVFEIVNEEEYIKQHQMSIQQVYHTEEKKVFVLDTSRIDAECIIPISASLMKNNLMYNSCSIESFVMHSEYIVTQDIFDEIVLKYVDNPKAEYISHIINYAIKNNRSIGAEFFKKTFNHHNEKSILSFLEYQKISKHPLCLTDDIKEEIIQYKQDFFDTNMLSIIEMNSLSLEDVIISLDPNHYLSLYIENSEHKSKTYISVAWFISRFKLNIDKVLSFIDESIKHIIGSRRHRENNGGDKSDTKPISMKKIASSFRLILNFITIYDSTPDRFLDFIKLYLLESYDALFNEIARITSEYKGIYLKNKEISILISNVERDFVTIPVFLEVLTTIYCYIGGNSKAFSNGINNALAHPLDSSKIKAIRCLAILLDSNFAYNKEVLYMLKLTLSNFYTLSANFFDKPILGPLITKIYSLLFSHHQIDNYKSDFIPKMVNRIWVNPNDPSFLQSLELIGLFLKVLLPPLHIYTNYLKLYGNSPANGITELIVDHYYFSCKCELEESAILNLRIDLISLLHQRLSRNSAINDIQLFSKVIYDIHNDFDKLLFIITNKDINRYTFAMIVYFFIQNKGVSSNYKTELSEQAKEDVGAILSGNFLDVLIQILFKIKS